MFLANTAIGSSHYLARSLDFERDIPISGLNCLCLSQDGFLWLGAKDGLVRFDGIRSIRVSFPTSDKIQGSNITALWEDGQKQLWIGCESGEVFCWDRHRGTVIEMRQKWPAHPIRSIAGDGRDDVWLALATHDLVRVRDGWTLHTPASPSTAGTVQHLLPTSDGRLYQQFGDMIRLEGGTREAPAWQDLRLAGTLIQRTAPSHQGGQWIFANDRVRLWTGTHWSEERGRLPPGTYITRMMEASAGDLFIGTLYQGLMIYRRDGTMQQLSDAASHGERIMDMLEDREGNILACSDRRLMLIRPSRVDVIASESNWGGCRPVSVASARDGTWWLGTEGSGLYHILPERTEQFTVPSGLRNPFVWSLLADDDDNLWVGTWGGGLLHRSGDKFTPASLWDASVHGWAVSAILRDRTGILWAATNTGLWRQVDGDWHMVTEDSGSPVMLVRALEEDGAGRVWLATNGHGLKYWEQGRVHALGAKDGIPARFISSLYSDNRQNLWVGTVGMGLYRLHENRWTHVDQQHGLPVDGIFYIAEDPNGKLWFTSPIGVFSVDRQELEDTAAGKASQITPLILDRGDGMPSSHCSSGTGSAACMTSDGRFLVPTSLGLALIPTDRITTRQNSVPVTITFASIDDQVITLSPDNSIRAPAGTRRVAVEFSAPSFSNPERIHFRYRLLGLDNSWVDLGTRRSVLFSHLPPGTYELRIMASNPDLVWNPTATIVSLKIDPYFWETEWFRIGSLMLLALLVGLMAWYIVHRRVRKRLAHLEAQQFVEQERRRIARDIHDELGASLTQIMMMSQAYGASPGGSDTTLLSRIHSVACGITKAMDELVWAVNPSHDTLESFAAYGAHTAQALVSSAGLRLRLNMPNQFPDIRLSSAMRHHLLLFLKEAINNALRHAHAHTISITLLVDDSNLHLKVHDDGQGFAPELVDEAKRGASPGGHGLPNLRQRAREMGGQIEIASTPQHGTTLHLTVHLSV